MFKEAKYKTQRQPKRHPLTSAAAIFIGGGILLSITIIGAIIGIPMIIAGLITLFIRSRIKVISVECPHCKTENKIEPTVTVFNCEQCSRTIRSEGNTYIAM